MTTGTRPLTDKPLFLAKKKAIKAVAPPLVLFCLLPFASPLARAQNAPGAAASPVSARAARQETLKQITTRLSETTGFRVLAESALAGQSIVAPEDAAVTPEAVEDYLTRLTRRLPPGASWYKVYLPASPAGDRPFAADAVAQLAKAQRTLLGRTAPNMVEIQGKVMTVEEAAPVIKTLGLTPVYVLAGKPGTTAAASAVAAASGSLNTSALMSALTKQLGVANVEAIPPGSYKVTLPGPDGSPMNATVDVSNTDGNRRIEIRMGGVPAKP